MKVRDRAFYISIFSIRRFALDLARDGFVCAKNAVDDCQRGAVARESPEFRDIIRGHS